MDKHTINFDGLYTHFTAPKIYKLADVEDRIERIGCGVVRFMDEKNKTGLWQINQDHDGNEYIAAMYDDVGSEEVVKNSWSVEPDRLNKTATIFYKNTPLKSIASAELNLGENEWKEFISHLPERLASSKNVVSIVLKSLDETYRDSILKEHPELFDNGA